MEYSNGSNDKVDIKPDQQFPTLLIADAAQEVNDCPWDAANTASRIYSDSMAWHKQVGLYDRDPGEADYLALRALWNAVVTPITFGIELRLLQEMLPRIRRGSPLTSSAVMDSNAFDNQLSRPYEGEALAVVRTMVACTTSAAEQFLQEITQKNHRLFPAWSVFAQYHPKYCDRERQYDGINRPTNPLEAVMEFTVDSNETTWSVIRRALGHFSLWGEAWEGDKKRGLLSIMDELGRPASTKKKLMDKYLNRYRDEEPKRCPFNHNDPRAGQGGIWDLPRLKEDKQYPPGYCPANSLQRAHFRPDRMRIEGLRDQVCVDSSQHRQFSDILYEALGAA